MSAKAKKIQNKKPYYNPKFHEWEICWNSSDGSYGGLWGNTKEDCIKRFKKLFN